MALTRGSTGRLNSSATRSRSSDMEGSLRRQAYEGQWRRRPEVDGSPRLGSESLPVQDDVGAVAFDRDLVGLLEMDPTQLRSAELAGNAGSEGAEDGARPLLDGKKLERSLA